nr:MAG TPA_asm: hypothetical protein [Caudoviricetes sp.]
MPLRQTQTANIKLYFIPVAKSIRANYAFVFILPP